MIRILERFSPYSRALHSKCLLPATSLVVDLSFPRLCIGNVEIMLPLSSGFCNATLQQDLERNCVWVFSDHFRMKIVAKPGTIVTALSQKGMPVQRETFPLDGSILTSQICEKLSLGIQKERDWDLVLRRFDLKEILPVLYFLAQKIPCSSQEPLEMRSLDALKLDLRSEFEHMLVPKKASMSLIRQTFEEVRSWFFAEQEDLLSFFSLCPFASGRMTNIQSRVGVIDLEWRKHAPRRMCIRSQVKRNIHLSFPQGIMSFRLKQTVNEKGARHSVKDPLCLEIGKNYFLDCFF